MFHPLSLSRLLLVLLLITGGAHTVAAQTSAALPRKLPSADKIVDNYLKAIGGKKKAAALKDATYEWVVQLNDQPIGTARTQRKTPNAERWELTFGNGQIVSATNARSAWEIGLDKRLRTLTGPESAAAKLRASLDSSHLVNFKKANVLARVVSLGDLASEPAYIVEFSTRNGARFHYYFSTKTSLITKITGDVRNTRVVFDDYKPTQGIQEPHRIRLNVDGSGELTLLLQSVKYDTGIEDRIFDPPAATETLDVAALLREVTRNQDEIEKRVAEYAFTQKETDREINSKGELKKETTKVYEIYPLPNREPVQRLISENGIPLSPERAAKEDRRVQEEFEKAERDKEKDEKKVARRRAEREKKESEGTEISPFLKACEFVSPRRENLSGREAIVFDFRPRPGFRPQNRIESLIAKLIGVIWIDPVDKQVIRLEARLAEGFKMAGGLLVSLKPGAALVMEQTRMEQGVWLPRFAQINLSVKVLLFAGGDFNKTIEWSDYKHFSGDVKDYKIDTPGAKP
ncbi:MAG TPA: hypothetical protein VFR78_20120 [Pyrinomonadaceae bacterium]|nr:hypothetical protein [Pyrinomonadaceae bacterium]